jgi:hypothetical protein
MAGPVPAIHVLAMIETWMSGIRPGMTAEGTLVTDVALSTKRAPRDATAWTRLKTNRRVSSRDGTFCI